MANSFNNLLLCLGFVVIFGQAMATRFIDLIDNQKIDTTWYDARATFYGDIRGDETMRKDRIYFQNNTIYLLIIFF